MAGISSQNKKVVENAFLEFRNKTMHDEIIKQLNVICQNLLISAIHYRLRLSHAEGHDFTGNLINSIVVVLYQDEHHLHEV